MQDILGESLRRFKKIRIRKNRLIAIVLVLSLMVSMDVFWVLRKPGWTLAGDADCGIREHTHSERCQSGETPCTLQEHVHSIGCYCDEAADTETQLDWQKMFERYPYTGNLRQDLAGIARTQVGYAESTQNFQVGSDGIRRGYTRYGAWYGVPYADWSAIFVSYCLHYAGADPAETPGNTGALSMAQLWQKLNKYASAGTYKPVTGDLAFFKNNTVGIVTEVQNTTFYVIRGDLEGKVRREAILLTDEGIAGWGVTEGTAPEETKTPDDYLLDISNGPAVFIIETGQTQPQMRRFALRATASAEVVDIAEYLKKNGGSYFYTLLDKNNQELPKDAAGNYIAQANTNYKLTISFTSLHGFAPGTYQYQIPNGLLVDGGQGSFVLKDGTNVGNWSVTNDGLITLYFNEHMNSRTEITISATLGIHFPEQDEPIDFDGKISVSVQKPPVDKEHTQLNKWGSQGSEEDEKDPNKLYWTIEIQGKADSQIPGSIITDHIQKGDHKFTQSDMDGGLRIGVGEYDLTTGAQIAWHAWDVYPGDPNLSWTETGWSYQIPESIICKWCPNPITLGNNGWLYYIEYTSTPEPAGVAGKVWYTNDVIIDGQYMEGWGGFEHAEAQANIIKNGSFHTDASGGAFLWEVQATIPSWKAGEKAVYLWQIMDNMRVKNNTDGVIGYIDNDADKAIVTATRGDRTFTVPNVVDATQEDELAWYILWSAEHSGKYYGRALVLLSRCHCTSDNCQFWENGSCGSKYWYEAQDGYWYTNNMCHCWTSEEDTIITIAYETNGVPVIETYGGQGHDLSNEALLQYTVYRQDGTPDVLNAGNTVKDVPIPGVFEKQLTHDFDGYTANYKITVNEGKIMLTNGTPLTIHDVMTETLVYISGSLVITAEDADGKITPLQQDVDYTVSYDGTGGATDAHGKPVHVLDIVILHPQPVMYTLDYDTTLVIPIGATEAVKYTNSASISLWGDKIADSTVEKVYADINIAAKNYKVEMFKTCALSGEPLGGATFGLFNAQGGLITTSVTDAKGELYFQSDIVEGIILREHVLYYMQELRAPPGYQLDDTKFWFCFCDEETDSCQLCQQTLAGSEAQRIPLEKIGKVHAANQLINYDLPATGGPGIYPLILVSVIFILTPLVYKFTRGRKRERRGVG